jgi:hypothetical protein
MHATTTVCKYLFTNNTILHIKQSSALEPRALHKHKCTKHNTAYKHTARCKRKCARMLTEAPAKSTMRLQLNTHGHAAVNGTQGCSNVDKGTKPDHHGHCCSTMGRKDAHMRSKPHSRPKHKAEHCTQAHSKVHSQRRRNAWQRLRTNHHCRCHLIIDGMLQ